MSILSEGEQVAGTLLSATGGNIFSDVKAAIIGAAVVGFAILGLDLRHTKAELAQAITDRATAVANLDAANRALLRIKDDSDARVAAGDKAVAAARAAAAKAAKTAGGIRAKVASGPMSCDEANALIDKELSQ